MIPTNIIPTKIHRLEISRESPLDMIIPTLIIEIMVESNPLTSGILVRRLAVRCRQHLRAQISACDDTGMLAMSHQDGVGHNTERLARDFLLPFSFAQSLHVSNAIPPAPECYDLINIPFNIPIRTIAPDFSPQVLPRGACKTNSGLLLRRLT